MGHSCRKMRFYDVLPRKDFFHFFKKSIFIVLIWSVSKIYLIDFYVYADIHLPFCVEFLFFITSIRQYFMALWHYFQRTIFHAEASYHLFQVARPEEKTKNTLFQELFYVFLFHTLLLCSLLPNRFQIFKLLSFQNLI